MGKRLTCRKSIQDDVLSENHGPLPPPFKKMETSATVNDVIKTYLSLDC